MPRHRRVSLETSIGAAMTLSADKADADLLSPGSVPQRVPGDRTAALRYPGSKWSIAAQIIGYFGPHYHYVEPYFGSGAVFFSRTRHRTSLSMTTIES